MDIQKHQVLTPLPVREVHTRLQNSQQVHTLRQVYTNPNIASYLNL